jgi:protein TonB
MPEEPPPCEPPLAEVETAASPPCVDRPAEEIDPRDVPSPPPEDEPVSDDRPSSPSGDERALVLSPVPCGDNLPPVYPRLARRRGQEGLVLLSVRVSLDGACLAVEVKMSSGHDALDRAARAAVERWRFEPARLDGAPVEAELEVPIRFQLTD